MTSTINNYTDNKLSNRTWGDIKGYEGLYQVSNYGEVRSFLRCIDGYVMTPRANQYGRLSVVLYANGKGKNFLVHRLVALSFVPNPRNLNEINHKDGNPKNNHHSNLEWCTSSENTRHAFANGLIVHPIGADWYHARKVEQYDFNGVHVKSWGCILDAATALGLCPSTITKCCKGKINSSGGYLWKYTNDTKPIDAASALKRKKIKRIKQIDKAHGTVVKVHESITAAAKNNGFGEGGISGIAKCLNGELKSTHGYLWQYAD